MTNPIKKMLIELTDPVSSHDGFKDGYHYGLRITEFSTDNPDQIVNIVEKDYWHREPLITAIEDLVTRTKLSIDFENAEILKNLGD